METEPGHEKAIAPQKRKRFKAIIVVTILIFCLLGMSAYDYYHTAQEEARKEAKAKASRMAKKRRLKAEAEERQRQEAEERQRKQAEERQRQEAEAAEAQRKREAAIAESARQKEVNKDCIKQAAEVAEQRRQAAEKESLQDKEDELPTSDGLMAHALKNAYFISEARPSPDAKYYIFLLTENHRIGFIREHYKKGLVSDGGELICLYTESEQDARRSYEAQGLDCPAMLWSDVPFLPHFPAGPCYGELFYTAVMRSNGKLETNGTEKCKQFLQDLRRYRGGNANTGSATPGTKNKLAPKLKKLQFGKEKPSANADFYLFAFLSKDAIKRRHKQLEEIVQQQRTNQSSSAKLEFIGITYGNGAEPESIGFPVVSIADPHLTKIPGYKDRTAQNPFFAVNKEGTPIPLWQTNDDYVAKPPSQLPEWRDQIKKAMGN